ncbi:MAG: hypothetical protein KC736_00390 [Candidatus Moranbacteria bacterium]|nr:hypothetical protein [Candidatus Moranbacteria bacterium]
MDIPKPPPLFQLIQDEAGISWREMVKNYNCGIGLVVIGSPEGGMLQGAVEAVSRESNVGCLTLGECWESSNKENHVVIETPFGSFYDPHKNL